MAMCRGLSTTVAFSHQAFLAVEVGLLQAELQNADWRVYRKAMVQRYKGRRR